MRKVHNLVLLAILFLQSGGLKTQDISIIRDENNLPKVQYGENYYYNPVTISREALHFWNREVQGFIAEILTVGKNGEFHSDPANIPLKKDIVVQNAFLNYADWFEKNGRIINGSRFYDYQFDYFPYLLKAPWVSSMGQAGALQILCRAFLLTKEKKYAKAAQQILNSYQVDFTEGGFVQYDGFGNLYFELYPGQPTTHVLNGHIFALFGLHDYWKVFHDSTALQLYEKGLETVRKRLPDYDYGDYSKYDLISMGQQFRFAYVNTAIASPNISASHSNQPEKHGPKRLIDGSNFTYWASNNFPVTISLQWHKPVYINDLKITGFSKESTPAEFSVKIQSENENFQRSKSNREKDFIIEINSLTDAIDLIIYSDNGNQNCAIRQIQSVTDFQALQIDSIALICNQDLTSASFVNIGENDNEGNSVNHNRIEGNWSQVFIDKKTSYREIFPVTQGKSANTVLNILIPKNANHPGEYQIACKVRGYGGTIEIYMFDGHRYKYLGERSISAPNEWNWLDIPFDETSLRARKAIPNYHQVVINQLGVLYALTQDTLYSHYQTLFRSF